MTLTTARRPKGTGGISPVGSERWRVRWRDTENRPRERTVSGPRSAAEAVLRAELAAVDRGEITLARDLTVADWLETYLGLVRPKLAVRSYRRYSRTIHDDLVPVFGRRRLVRLDERHVAAAMESWQRQGLSNSAINWRINILRMALGRAVKARKLMVNVATFVDLLPTRRARPNPPSDETIDALLAAVAGHPYELAYAIAIGTGMRSGEILALRWRDVDLAAGRIDIRLSRIYGTEILKVTKTEAGERWFPMPTWLAVRLAERRGDPDGWVVSTRSKRSTDAKNLWRRLQTICDELGVPPTNFRQIRHYAITRQLERGVPMAEVSRAAGHSTIKMTVDTYAHVLPGQAIADAMER